jgi:DNA-binding response OmpR family regulator
MHALIIEDEALVAQLIEDILLDQGFQTIDFAVCADDAVAAVRSRKPTLITSDVQLIESNGIDAIELILSFHVPRVIFVTSSPQEVRYRMPHMPVVTKPFAARDLIAHL